MDGDRFRAHPRARRSDAADQRPNELDFLVEELALGEQSGTFPLYISKASDSSNSLRSDFRPWDRFVDVPVVTLDEYCRSNGVRPSVIKIDTEATEPAVLRGGLTLLERERPWIICEVLAGRTEEALAEVLGPLRYRYYHIAEGGSLTPSDTIVGDATYLHRDWLFAPDDVDDDLVASTRDWFRRLERFCVPAESTLGGSR